MCLFLRKRDLGIEHAHLHFCKYVHLVWQHSCSVHMATFKKASHLKSQLIDYRILSIPGPILLWVYLFLSRSQKAEIGFGDSAVKGLHILPQHTHPGQCPLARCCFITDMCHESWIQRATIESAHVAIWCLMSDWYWLVFYNSSSDYTVVHTFIFTLTFVQICFHLDGKCSK